MRLSRILVVLSFFGAEFCWAEAAMCTKVLKVAVRHSEEAKWEFGDELLTELQKRTSCIFQITEVPLPRTEMMLKSGEIDIAMAVLPTEDRLRNAWYVPYGVSKNMAVTRKGVDAKSAEAFLAQPRWTMCELSGRIQGLKLYSNLVEQLRAAGRVTVSYSAKSMYDMFEAGRCELIVVPPISYRPQLKLRNLETSSNYWDWSPKERGDSFGMLLSRASMSEESAKHWKETVNAMRRDGTMKRLYEHFFTAQEAEQFQKY